MWYFVLFELPRIYDWLSISNVDELYVRLARIVEEEFPNIIEHAEIRRDRLRLHITDGSFLDV